MTDTSNVQNLPARPARRRKTAAASPAVTAQPAFLGDNIAMALGELTGVVSGMQEAVREMKADAGRERVESIASRRRIHESISELKDRVHDIDLKVSRVLNVDDRLVVVEAEAAKTRRIREWSAQIAARGWKLAVGVLGLTGASALVWFRDQIGLAARAIHNFFL